MDSAADTLAGGLPHSEISGSKPARGSPKLFAACHVLHRLLAPRHPPDALAFLDPPQRQPHPRGARPSPRWVIKQQPTKAYPCFPDARPRRKRRRACVHACQRPLAQRCTDAQRPASVPANGLSSPLHDVKDRATGSTGGGSPRHGSSGPPHETGAGGSRRGRGSLIGFRGPDGPGRLPRPPCLARPAGRWWAWADLNGRPHAYQACALTS